MELVYDPENSTMSYGFYRCPHCNAEFYGGGKALHERSCPKKDEGYKVCEYHFGDKEVATVKRQHEILGDRAPRGHVNMTVLHEQFSHLL